MRPGTSANGAENGMLHCDGASRGEQRVFSLAQIIVLQRNRPRVTHGTALAGKLTLM
jgi:hypothetical protein